jgi:hypothetical protein
MQRHRLLRQSRFRPPARHGTVRRFREGVERGEW